jgi:hypothetical protein
MNDNIIAAQHFEGDLYIKASDHHRVVRAKIEAEREACAKLVESRKTGGNDLMDAVRHMEARAIRARGTIIKLEDIFTAEELLLIDSGQYRPGRAALDAKLDLISAMEREACANAVGVLEPFGKELALQKATIEDCVAAIRARGQA